MVFHLNLVSIIHIIEINRNNIYNFIRIFVVAGHVKPKSSSASAVDNVDTQPMDDIMDMPTPDPTPKRPVSSHDVTKKRQQYQNLPSVVMDGKPLQSQKIPEGSPGSSSESTRAPTSSCSGEKSKSSTPDETPDGVPAHDQVVDPETNQPLRRFRRKKPSSFLSGASQETLPLAMPVQDEATGASDLPEVLRCKEVMGSWDIYMF